MCPAIIVDDSGDVRLVTGAAGGTKITSATALTSVYNIWFGREIDDAIIGSRMHHQLYPMELEFEEGFRQVSYINVINLKLKY